MLKTLLLLCFLACNAGIAACAEKPIRCYVNPNGDVIYSNRKCPEGFLRVNGLLALSAISPRVEEAYTPIVPVESTADALLSEKEVSPAKVKSVPIIYYDENGNLTMIFNDGLQHGQEWGDFRRRYYGLYPCGPSFCSQYSCCCGSSVLGVLSRSHVYDVH